MHVRIRFQNCVYVDNANAQNGSYKIRYNTYRYTASCIYAFWKQKRWACCASSSTSHPSRLHLSPSSLRYLLLLSNNHLFSIYFTVNLLYAQSMGHSLIPHDLQLVCIPFRWSSSVWLYYTLSMWAQIDKNLIIWTSAQHICSANAAVLQTYFCSWSFMDYFSMMEIKSGISFCMIIHGFLQYNGHEINFSPAYHFWDSWIPSLRCQWNQMYSLIYDL